MALIALKTDGGGYLGARSYFAGQKAKLDRWLIGADDQGKLYKSVMGKDGLWHYLIIDPEGRIAAKGDCSMHHKRGDKTVYSLGNEDLVAKYGKGKTTTLLPKDKKYDPALELILTALRCNDYAYAIGRCSRLAKKKGKQGEPARALLQDILAGLAKEGDKAKATLLGKEPAPRFGAYMKLRTIATVAPKHAAGKASLAAMKSVRSDKGIKLNLAAEKAYWKVMNRINRSKKWVPPKIIAKRLTKVAKKYPETLFGNRAAMEAKATGK